MKKVTGIIILLCFLMGQMHAQNNALHFDGSDDRVTGTNASLPQGNNPRTIEAWVNYNANDRAVFTYGTEVTNQLFSLLIYNGVYIVGFNNDFSTNSGYNNNVWHHIAVTHDGTTTTVYVNGNSVGAATRTYNTTGTNFQIGAIQRSGGNYTNLFTGSIDEVRVWNVVRTQSEIQNNMNVELSSGSGLIAAYHFNQGIAGGNNAGVTTLTDAAGSNNGTLSNFTLSGSSSNFVSGPSSLLPVELKSFTTVMQGKSVLLHWQTASESNNQGFEVMHSKDGIKWEMLGFVSGHGTSLETYHYSYLHSNPAIRNNYYRLRQIDHDGSFEFSKVVSIFIADSDKLLRIFPTITEGMINIENPSNEPMQISVFNSAGQLVLAANDANFLDISSLDEGLYFVRLRTTRDILTERILKK